MQNMFPGIILEEVDAGHWVHYEAYVLAFHLPVFFYLTEIQGWGIPQNRLQIYQVNKVDDSSVRLADPGNNSGI